MELIPRYAIPEERQLKSALMLQTFDWEKTVHLLSLG